MCLRLMETTLILYSEEELIDKKELNMENCDVHKKSSIEWKLAVLRGPPESSGKLSVTI